MMNLKLNKILHLSGLSIIILTLLTSGSGCATKPVTPERFLSFEQQLSMPNDKLEKQARIRKDKFSYGQGRAGLIFPVYYPLALPNDLEYKSFKLKPSSFEGEIGLLVINYIRNDDKLTVFQGHTEFDDSEILQQEKIELRENEEFDNTKIVISDDKPNGFFQKRASGYLYIGWGGGPEGFANDEPIYLIKAKGFSREELKNMAKKMVQYE